MRICYVYGGVHGTDGGIGFLRNLCSGLRLLGHSCCTVLGENHGLLMEGSVDHEIHLNGDWSFGFGASQRRTRNLLRSTLNELQPDVVHIIHPAPYYGARGHIHTLPVFWRDFPVIATFWGFNIGPGSNWLTRALVLWLLWGSQAIASHDFTLMAEMRKLCLGMREVHFLPVGSNIHAPRSFLDVPQRQLRLRYGLDLDEEAQYIAYFGGFDQGMGVENLFQAVRRLREDGHKRLRLLLIGWQRHLRDPRFLAMKHAIARERVEDIVIMTPFAPDEEVAGLLRAADLVALPFHHNAMGRTSLMAALSAGAPVILAASRSDLGPLNGAVVRVPPKSPEILAQNIESLLKEPHRTKELGLSGRRVWENYFSWPVIANQHLQLYKNLQK
jgi:glycosyltransferase involved in cell wall biosynthesis